jgi:ectoine hydroxylase-related dioxygenase (phytanoyl-CoA dioxygenase family)
MINVAEYDGAFPDMTAAREELDRQGYCVIPDVLTKEQVSALKERLIEQAAGEQINGVATNDGGSDSPNQRVWNLLNKGKIFRDLMLHPVVEAVMGHMLGRDFLLSSFTANIARKGGDPMVMHTDQIYVGFWTAQPMVANIAWMLDDFTDENGGTRLIPKSHLDSEMPKSWDTIAGEGKAGSVLCFDGRLWHGTGANSTDAPRHALLSYHCRPFIRQQENLFLGLDPDVVKSERPELLNRLGFQPWAGLGRVESRQPAVPLYVSSGAVGPLMADGKPFGK